MRILLLFTLGFATACALCAYALGVQLWVLCCVVAILLAFTCLLIRAKAGKIGFVILLGLSVGFLWMICYDHLYLAPVRNYDGETVTAQIRVTDYSQENYFGIGADGKISLDGKNYRIRVYLDGLEQLQPGNILTGQIELQATIAGGTGRSDYHHGMGVFLKGYMQEGFRYEPADQLAYSDYPVVFRAYMLELMEKIFPEDTLGFAQALLLGDDRQLSYAEDTAYKLSGIRHVVAVSGLHISILFSLVYIAVGKRRVLTALIGIPVLVLFAAVAGFSPSVVRACTMQCLMIVAMLLRKDYDPLTALATSALLILLCNPMAVLSVSLQLSVGSMAGIFLFSRSIQGWLSAGKLGELAKGKHIRARVVQWCLMSVSVTLSAMSLTTPLCAYYFGMVSLVGIWTNLLCLWMVSFIFCGIMLSCAVGAFWLYGGQAIAMVVSTPISFVKDISQSLSELPMSAVYTCSQYIVIWLVFAYIFLGIFLLSKKKRPLLLALSILITLCMAVGASHLEPMTGNYLATVMDVGQGQCVLLRCGSRNYLVDCGGEDGQAVADKAANLLLSQGIVALDGLIVTHFDVDHVNGVEYLMQRVAVADLYLPDAPDNTRFRRELTAAYADRITWVSQDTQFGRDDWRITVFAGEMGKTGNESSLCVLFQRQNCDILITGDRSIKMEDALLDRWTLPQLEMLVVGHHGSASSTGFRLLAETKPAYCVISVGQGNRYDHPSQEALDRLERSGCVILRTDRDGDINFGR